MSEVSYDPLELEEDELDSSADATTIEPLEVFIISPHAILRGIDPKLDLSIGLHGQEPMNGVNGHSSTKPVDVSDDEGSSSDSDGPVNRHRPAPPNRSGTSDPRMALLESHLQLLQRDPRHFGALMISAPILGAFYKINGKRGAKAVA